MWLIKRLILMLALTAVPTACGSVAESEPTYPIVLSGGRVIDADTGTDAVRNVGIRDGRIEILSDEPLKGERTIDVKGLVVAPGFIDLHAHGQSDEAFGLMAQDGVTSAFELEVGTADVEHWYAEREGGQILNYGVSIGHIPVRMEVMGDSGGFLPSGPAGHTPASSEQIEQMKQALQKGLEEGAVAVGFGLAYTPAASIEEFETMLQVAAGRGASAHIHVREGVKGVRQAIESAAKTGTPLHVVHANSSGGAEIAEFLALIEEARQNGQDVTTEAYPYEAGMTSIQSALFDDWESWDDEKFAIHQLVETGERLTRKTFSDYRTKGGNIIIHSRTEEMTQTAIASPLTMIASDGFLSDGKGHPRTSGTYARVLGKYVRELKVLTLQDAIRKMTLEPAKRLEPVVPAMARKGRLQVGADADITVFDPATVLDRSTYTDPTLTSEGIRYVLVNGVVVVEDGELATGVRPGKPVRAAH